MLGLGSDILKATSYWQHLKLKSIILTHILIFVTNFIITWYLTQGDWRKNHTANKDSLYVIEPVIESLLQVIEKFRKVEKS